MPLTDAQKLLHWKRWNACCHANDWSEAKKRLHPQAQATRDLSIYHKLIWREAEKLALQEHRSVTAEDLRHACYLVATAPSPLNGERAGVRGDASMSKLTNRHFSRVLVLWSLLIEPDDLDALMKWEHPEISEGEGLDKSISRLAPDEYTRTIAGRIYGTRLWEDLDVQQKRNLRRILLERKKNWNEEEPHAKAATAATECNAPF
jgi:hypothetical protein